MYAANQVAQHAMCSDVLDSETNRILPVAVQYFIFVALCHFVLQYVEVVIQLRAEYAKLVFLFQRLIEVFFPTKYWIWVMQTWCQWNCSIQI